MRSFPFASLSFAALLLACTASKSDPLQVADTGPLADTSPADVSLDTADPEDVGPAAPPDWDRSVTPPTDDDATTKRASCTFKAGALPAESQGASRPMGKKIPIDHVVVIMQENRSFDHYFWKLKEAGHPDAEVAPPDFTNPDLTGKPVAPFHDSQLCFVDTAHGWNAVHTQYDDGKMDGFYKSNDHESPIPPHGTDAMVTGMRAMAYYDGADLPFMYWAADQFSIGDHYHCSILGPTWPNRMYLYAASSFGKTDNSPPDASKALTIFDELQMRRVTWKIYTSAVSPGFAMFVSQYLKFHDFHVFEADQYFEDAKNGTLPEVSFVDPVLGKEKFDQNDEHPPAMMQVGQAYLAKVTKALIDSPLWPSSALFITYDEHGGLWDHVVPPNACPPDALAPALGPSDAPGKFDRLGIRVPFVVVSPFAKKHFIGHHVYDHTSILRFIESRFTLPALTARDANAEAPWEMFDFTAPRTDKPTVPDVPIDAAKLAACKAIFVP